MPLLEATPASTDSAAGGADQSLPDPSPQARKTLAVLLLVSLVAAVLMNSLHLTAKQFTPPAGDANFVLLAAFYAAAQIIERLMELVVPLLPAKAPKGTKGSVAAAYIKADRAKVALGVATVAAVVISAALGLYFLQVLGVHASHTVDTFATGLLIGAGTKPLHDFIGLISKPTNPTTGTTTASTPRPPAKKK
jgi:hypothetical protein